MRNHTLFALLFFVFLGINANSQCGPLNTPQVTNNGQDGIMFDIVALQSVNIVQLGMDFDTGTGNTIRIYKKVGTHVGFANNAAAWTLVGEVTGWASTSNQNVLIPIQINHYLCPGQVVAFYVTNTVTANCNYSNGTGVGNTAAQDANIRILQGTGKDYPFGTSFTPRVPNVRVNYNCATSCCQPPTMSSTPTSCAGICDGTATATVGAGGVGPYTYSWNTVPVQTTQTATGLCAGTYTVSVTDATGCVATGTVNVTNGNSTANATINPSGPYCILSPPTNLTAVTPGGTWSGTGITNTTLGTFNPNTSGAGTFSITYTIPGACGASQTTNIVVNPAANTSITAVGPFCETDPSITLSAVDPGGTWAGTGITNSTAGTFDPTTAGPGTHTISYTIGGVCGGTSNTNIIVNPSYSAVINPAGPFCADANTVNLSAADPGGTWSGTGITDVNLGTFNPSVAGAGTHTITYSISGTCGDIQSTDIIVNPLDDATITTIPVQCLGGPIVNLTAITSGGTWSGPGIVNAALGQFDPSVAGQGTHIISYITNGPCPDNATVSIQVLGPLTLQASGTNTICDGETTPLNAIGNGGDGNLIYVWTDETGNNVGSGTSINVSPSTTTMYTVTLSDGCTTPSQTASVLITVNPIPLVTFNPINALGCEPYEVDFTSPVYGPNATCSWNFGNGQTSSNCGGETAVYNQAGCYDVTLTVTENGCVGTLTVPNAVCVGENPVADFASFPETAEVFYPEIEFVNQSQNAEIYQWSFGDGFYSNDENPVHVYPEEAAGYDVCLVAINAQGCTDTVCHGVQIIESLIYYIPNTFTPNADEHNQTFSPIFYSGIDPYNFSFKIYNKWGELIWETNDPNIGWDGNGPNGALVQSGTYVWTLFTKSKENDKKITDTGYVNVLR
jgi:gliding motility-associated-like protein